MTAWGGMKLVKDLVEGTEIRSFLGRLNLPQPGSNRGYSPVDIIDSFLVSIWIGASRSYGSKFGDTHHVFNPLIPPDQISTTFVA